MLELNELQRLADASIKDGDWFPPDFGQGHLLREDAAYIAAMSPGTAKKLIAVARAARELNEAGMSLALFTALEELKGKT